MSRAFVLDDVRAGYGPVEVLHDVRLTFPAGAISALVGPNGAGKSTVLRVAAGLIRPREGRLWWDGEDVTRWSAQRRVQAGLTYVADEHNVFTSLTVAENLDVFGRPRSSAESVALTIDAFPALRPLLEHRAGTLSGGERQMLALARVMLRPGRLLLLDEVSRGLSPAVAAHFYERLRDLVAPDQVVVICEQFLDTALGAADVVYALRRGQVAFAGDPTEAATELAGTHGR